MFWQCSLASIPVSVQRLLPRKQHYQLAETVMKIAFKILGNWHMEPRGVWVCVLSPVL